MKDKGAIKLGIDALKEIQKSRGMPIPKAIEILTKTDPYSPHTFPPDYKGALTLGIEALKWKKKFPRVTRRGQTVLLPGETKD